MVPEPVLLSRVVHVKFCVEVNPPPAAVTVTLKMPLVVGVPEISPNAAFILSPAGKPEAL